MCPGQNWASDPPLPAPSPMTCQSSESSDTSQSRAVESDERRIAAAMKDLRNTGRTHIPTHTVNTRQAVCDRVLVWF